MNHLTDTFFRLIRLGLGTENYIDFPTLSTEEWKKMVDMAKRQTLTGILIDGIECLPQDKKPEKAILIKLISLGLMIEKMNRRINEKAVKVSEYYSINGFSPILLKGQGIATFYKKPHHRMPGDIDLWLPDGRKNVTGFVKKEHPEAEVLYHHIHIKEADKIEVELHLVPTLLYNPFANKRLQAYFKEWKNMGKVVELPYGVGKVIIPCKEMNMVFMLIHKYRHLFSTGIGLRQIVDYMMLLQSGFTEEERNKVLRIIDELHLTEFCRSVMYVLKDVLGMEERHFLTEPSEKYGKKLLNEILIAGNFGKYDHRIDTTVKQDSIYSFIATNKRNMRFLKEYTNEVLWAPYFKIYNWFWRRRNIKL